MAYTTSDKGRDMDFSEPGWWAIASAAVAGFVGWRMSTAKDAVRIETMQREQEAMKERLRSLESGSLATATALAKLGAQMDGISHTLTRLENKMDGKADK
jgi:hypothetical protein